MQKGPHLRHMERVKVLPSLCPYFLKVERAAKLLRDVAKGRQVMKVDTFDDQIVYAGTTHQEFEQELSGRVVKDVQRYGKVFYILLEGEGKHPVLHFGMTGMLQPPSLSSVMQFVLHILAEAGPLAPVTEVDKGSIQESSTIQIAFLDPRRLARIRLCSSPLTEPPICDLGFDPILSMPSLEAFSARVRKRSCPIKALLLDQSFSAGVGNWVADEILYHARVHPEQRCNVLSEGQIQQLYDKTVYVAKTAVDGKGKKKNSDDPLLLPSGQPATIKFITVGGRTSAYVSELQRLQKNVEAKSSKEARDDSGGGEESDLTPLAESDADPEPAPKPSSQTRSSARKRKATKTTYRLAEVLVVEPEPAPKRRRESRA
ncbi:AtMMH-1 [Ephemerocybe angulata]|uniref:AtMMH-1 n=1 Tax=Ephemerocybe angulata TaxID=980116 RepID=A0A8H6IKM6_9AGAR|nr:AtMMH-1 [Tulosesus angulatus]